MTGLLDTTAGPAGGLGPGGDVVDLDGAVEDGEGLVLLVNPSSGDPARDPRSLLLLGGDEPSQERPPLRVESGHGLHGATELELGALVLRDVQEHPVRVRWVPGLVSHHAGLVSDPDDSAVPSHEPVLVLEGLAGRVMRRVGGERALPVLLVEELDPELRAPLDLPGAVPEDPLDLGADVDRTEPGWAVRVGPVDVRDRGDLLDECLIAELRVPQVPIRTFPSDRRADHGADRGEQGEIVSRPSTGVVGALEREEPPRLIAADDRHDHRAGTAAPLEDILRSHTVTFDTPDGAVITGELYGSGKTAVIFSVMGNCKPGWREFAWLTAAQGLMALTYPWRGCRASGFADEDELQKFVEDARGAITFVREQGAEKIILVGASLGGLASAKLAIESGASGIVIVASPPRIPDWGFEIESSDLNTDIPKLFITAENDPTVPASATRQLHDLAAEPKEWQTYPGYEHGTDIFETESGEAMRQRILQFILGLAS